MIFFFAVSKVKHGVNNLLDDKSLFLKMWTYDPF